ncbi:MAG: DUF2167 domain-containing protein [Verrucomicrobiales bacterium]
MKFRSSLLAAVPALVFSCAAITTAQESSPAAPEAGPVSEAQSQFQKAIAGLDWKNDGQGDIGGMATISVPSGFTFTGREGTIKMMELYGNLTSGQEGGYLAPQNHSWFAVFEFDEVGYVKDDEKDKLDANEILKQMQEGQKEANKELSRRGMETLEVVGWKTPPFYNPATNNLEWAIILRTASGGQTLNYKTKLLGRKGVMDVVLVCDEKELDTVLPQFQDLIKGFAFNPGNTYAEYKKGDKIAQYGLTGLIIGGGLLAAAKSGLLSKLIKPIIGGLLIIGVFIKRLFGGKSAA